MEEKAPHATEIKRVFTKIVLPASSTVRTKATMSCEVGLGPSVSSVRDTEQIEPLGGRETICSMITHSLPMITVSNAVYTPSAEEFTGID